MILSDADIAEINDKIVESIHPLEIYIFGSYSLSVATEESDLDLLIIVDDSKNIFEVNRIIQKVLRDRSVPIDILVRQKKQLLGSIDNAGSFLHEINSSMRRLYVA